MTSLAESTFSEEFTADEIRVAVDNLISARWRKEMTATFKQHQAIDYLKSIQNDFSIKDFQRVRIFKEKFEDWANWFERARESLREARERHVSFNSPKSEDYESEEAWYDAIRANRAVWQASAVLGSVGDSSDFLETDPTIPELRAFLDLKRNDDDEDYDEFLLRFFRTAVTWNHAGTIRYLVNTIDMDVNSKAYFGYQTALQSAIVEGRLEATLALLDCGADASFVKDKHEKIVSPFAESVRLYLQFARKAGVTPRQLVSSAEHAVTEGYYETVLEFSRYGVFDDIRFFSIDVMSNAAKVGSIPLISFLVDKGFLVRQPNRWHPRFHPLCVAVANGRMAAFQYMISVFDSYPDLSLIGGDSTQPYQIFTELLSIAIETEPTQIVDKILQYPLHKQLSKVGKIDSSTDLPLFAAIKKHDIGLVRKLVANGFAIDIDDGEDDDDSDTIKQKTALLDTRRVASKTPLFCAVYYFGGDSGRIVRFLLDNGANVYDEYRVRINKSLTLWQLARARGWPATLEVLKEYLLSKNLWPPNPAY